MQGLPGLNLESWLYLRLRDEEVTDLYRSQQQDRCQILVVSYLHFTLPLPRMTSRKSGEAERVSE